MAACACDRAGAYEADRLVICAGAWARALVPAWPTGGAGAPGPRLAAADPRRALRAGIASRSSSSTSRRAATTASRCTTSRLQVRPVPPPRRADRSVRSGPTDAARRRGRAARLRRALLPRGRRPDRDAQGLHVRELARRALHARRPARTRRRSRSSPASPATATSSHRSSARSSPTWRSTAAPGTTSASCDSSVSPPTARETCGGDGVRGLVRQAGSPRRRPVSCEREAPAPRSASPFGDTRLPQVPIERHALDNGLRVVLSRDPRAPIVAVNLWYDVGSRRDRPASRTSSST